MLKAIRQIPRGWCCVNVYDVNRAYGGAEEGGWWFDCGAPLRTIHVRQRDAERCLRRVERVLAEWNRGAPPLHSVACMGVYQARIEDQPAQAWPNPYPHYE